MEESERHRVGQAGADQSSATAIIERTSTRNVIFLRAILLFGHVCLHLVGGATLFRRLFPRECKSILSGTSPSLSRGIERSIQPS
jgi:hypothetical protein